MTKVAVPSTTKKYIKLDELEQTEKGPVYVLNNLKDNFKGMIVIPIARRNGNGHDVVRVPPTFIPVNLADQVSKVQLLDSTEFRQTINKGLIRLLHPDYAKTILSSEEAQVEAQEVANNMSRARTMVEASLLNESKPKGVAAMVNTEEDADPMEASGQVKKAKIPPSDKVVKFVRACLDLSLSSNEIVAKLKTMTLKTVDIKYAMQYFKTFPKVKAHLEKLLEAKKKAKTSA